MQENRKSISTVLYYVAFFAGRFIIGNQQRLDNAQYVRYRQTVWQTLSLNRRRHWVRTTSTLYTLYEDASAYAKPKTGKVLLLGVVSRGWFKGKLQNVC